MELLAVSKKRKRQRRSRPRGKTHNVRNLRAVVRTDPLRHFVGFDGREACRAILGFERPKTRDECRGSGLGDPGNPCPWVGCENHLYLDVTRNGSLRINFPDREPWELEETCSAACAERRGSLTLEQVGELTNLTRERIRQVEVKALLTLRAIAPYPHDDSDPRLSSTSDASEGAEIEHELPDVEAAR